MTIQDILGTYNIIGSNQNNDDNEYTGTLSLTLNSVNRIAAKWLINHEQEQFGTGFFKDNVLVINFYYFGEREHVFKGVVVYRCLSKDLLDGFWSEDYGDPNFLGEERCFRIQGANVLMD